MFRLRRCRPLYTREMFPSRATPVVTVGLIAVNVLVFFYQLVLPEFALEQFVATYAVVPAWFW